MKVIFLILSLIIVPVAKAQQILPLNTFLDDIPQNAYVKDLNHELDPYIGTYTASFEGNHITLFITKKEKKLEESFKKNYYMDALIVKYVIKNSAGDILQDTRNNNSDINSLYSIRTRPKFGQVVLSYYGTNCMVGWGIVYLKKLNDNQISWDYRPNSLVIDENRCPGNPDLTVYLPESQNLIFTKQ